LQLSIAAEPERGRRRITPTGIERKLGEQDIIVSKTDTKGRITYANRIFVEIADYRESEVLGRPHNLIRHPEMPRAVFALLWERVQAKRELFAYVVNLCKGGDHYWVLAHVTPSFDAAGTVIGYHSNRRRPSEQALQLIQPLYAELLRIEASDTDRRRGLERSSARLHEWAAQQGKSYDALMFAL
jgi:PAS domain S-box-containing protein